MLLLGWPHGIQTNNKYVYVLWITAGATRASYNEHFRHPTLSEEKMKSGCRLGLDNWADASCSGNHAYVEEFVEDKWVTATGFSVILGSMKYLSVVNILYDFDK